MTPSTKVYRYCWPSLSDDHNQSCVIEKLVDFCRLIENIVQRFKTSQIIARNPALWLVSGSWRICWQDWVRGDRSRRWNISVSHVGRGAHRYNTFTHVLGKCVLLFGWCEHCCDSNCEDAVATRRWECWWCGVSREVLPLLNCSKPVVVRWIQ